jgi:hypothetical protein
MSRHNIQRNWKAEQQRQRAWTALKQIKTVEIPVDREFWKLWHGDRAAMVEAGYRIKKVGDKWRAFLTK